YVIAPPSVHPDTGQPYQWGKECPFAELPAQAVEALAPPKPRVTLPAPVSEHSGNLNGLVRSVSEAVEGERNQKLFWAACRAFDHGDTDIIQELFEAALSVGLTDSEASATIDSARRTERQPVERYLAPDRSQVKALGNPQNENSHLSRHRDESDKRNVSHSESDSSVESGKAPGSNNDAEPNHDAVKTMYPVLDWATMWDEKVEEEWIIYPILPARRMVSIYSPPKQGKSLIMLE